MQGSEFSLDPITKWKQFNKRIATDCTGWKNELLEIIAFLDRLWQKGKLNMGTYRQKGNLLRDTIHSLLQYNLRDMKNIVLLREATLKGRTDSHRIDLCVFKKEIPVIAIEIKMIGSPPHLVSGIKYNERPVGIDIDKRLKEVKYTAVDLKRALDPAITQGWNAWLQSTLPLFFSFWLLRVGIQNNVERILEKLNGLLEYNNGVAVEIYETANQEYTWLEPPSTRRGKLLSFEEAVNAICHKIENII